MPVHRRVTPTIKFACTHLWVERGTVRVKCLAQEHNKMSPAKIPNPNHSIRSRAHKLWSHRASPISHFSLSRCVNIFRQTTQWSSHSIGNPTNCKRLQNKLSRTNKRYDTYLSQQKAHQEIPFTVIISQFTVMYSSQSWTETKKTIKPINEAH